MVLVLVEIPNAAVNFIQHARHCKHNAQNINNVNYLYRSLYFIKGLFANSVFTSIRQIFRLYGIWFCGNSLRRHMLRCENSSSHYFKVEKNMRTAMVGLVCLLLALSPEVLSQSCTQIRSDIQQDHNCGTPASQ